MKKFLKIFTMFIAAIVIVFLVLGVALCFFLPLNTIKDFAAAKLSQQLHREVKINGIAFSIFSGIKLKGVTISNAAGFSKKPMLSADVLELKYAFWPLFQGKVIIPEINFVKPEILIEKDRNGQLNLDGMMAQDKATKASKPKNQKTKASPANISLIINTFKISGGQIIYRDYFTGDSGLKDACLTVSNITLAALKPIDIKFSANGIYQDHLIPISLTTSLGIDIQGDEAAINNFSLSIAGDTLNASAELKKLKTSPQISIKASSNKITIDPFLAIFAGGAPAPTKKEALPHGTITKSLEKTVSSIPKNVSVSADLDLKNIILKTLKIDSLSFSLSLKNRIALINVKDFSAYKGKLFVKKLEVNLPALSYSLDTLELHGFTATPFINDVIDSFVPTLIDMKNNVEGSLDISLSLKGAGVEMPEAFDNLKASGVILLSKGRLKKLKSLASIGEQYNLNTLKQDIIVGGLRINASIVNKLLTVSKLSLQDTDFQTEFQGGLNFNKMEYVSGNRLNLKFSPTTTQDFPKELSIFRDNNGMLSLDFELTGSLYKPIPRPLFDKPIEAAIGKLKIKIEVKKVEIETQAQQQLKTAEAEAKKKLEEEAKKKVKEIFKF